MVYFIFYILIFIKHFFNNKYNFYFMLLQESLTRERMEIKNLLFQNRKSFEKSQLKMNRNLHLINPCMRQTLDEWFHNYRYVHHYCREGKEKNKKRYFQRYISYFTKMLLKLFFSYLHIPLFFS